RRHTSFSRDWSSDVCSSDLHRHRVFKPPGIQPGFLLEPVQPVDEGVAMDVQAAGGLAHIAVQAEKDLQRPPPFALLPEGRRRKIPQKVLRLFPADLIE